MLPVKHFHRVRHKPILALALIILFALILDKISASTENEPQQPQITTPEPVAEASPGCKAPDIRFTVLKPDTTTEQPYAKFQTTQTYMAEDLTTPDAEFVDGINIDLTGRQLSGNQVNAAIANRYHVDIGETDIDAVADMHAALHDDEELDEDDDDLESKPLNQQNRKPSKKRRSGGGRRRRIENENGQSRGRGSRYKRQVLHHGPDASPGADKWSGSKLSAEGDVYYVHIDDILLSKSLNQELRSKLHKLKVKSKKKKCAELPQKGECTKRKKKFKSYDPLQTKFDQTIIENPDRSESMYSRISHHRRRDDSQNENHVKNTRENNDEHNVFVGKNNVERNNGTFIQFGGGSDDFEGKETYINVTDSNGVFQRVKRKSGKTTGALSRPKGGGDSSSKTTSRKDKGIYDEEGGYSPVHPDDTDDEEEEEEDEEVDIQQKFTEVSEIRFPGEIGPLGDRRLCKIRCVKGKWVGPLCATNEEDDLGNVKFQPLYKSCHVNRIPPHLLLSYRNISVTTIRGSRRNRTSKPTFVSNTQIKVGWDLPHGHSLQARCKDLGLYKLLGESRVLCSNGLWAPRMPSCVPTTLLTNFSDDSAPSIRYRVLNGSAAFEPSGVLAVLPSSTVHMDCIYPRSKGQPEWTWTSWYMQYSTGWSHSHEDKGYRYRLTIKDIQFSDSGTFTCTSPRGLTNSIAIVVATSTCPLLQEPVKPLTLRLEGNKLGQRAMYSCPPGFSIDGAMNATCLASGNWSSPPPKCQAVLCPRLLLDDPHLSLVELNTSAWGRAVFKCQWGFKLTGPPVLECLPSGVWSGPVPRCKEIQCPIPVAPLNGRTGGTNLNQRRLTVGALITFSCNEGHTLVGEASIICTEAGVWSHSPPFCKSQCPYPGDPPNGLIAPLKFNYDSGDYLSVQCRPGYVQFNENGPTYRPKCQPDGNWSGPVPQCRSYEEV